MFRCIGFFFGSTRKAVPRVALDWPLYSLNLPFALYLSLVLAFSELAVVGLHCIVLVRSAAASTLYMSSMGMDAIVLLAKALPRLNY